MKKIYSSVLALLMLGACNPMEDIYKELDELEKPISKAIEYSLTDGDYSTVANLAFKKKTAEDSLAGNYIKKNKAFSDTYKVNDYLPALFASLYPGLQDGSSVKATYNYYEGAFPQVKQEVVSVEGYRNLGKDDAKYLCLSESMIGQRLDGKLVTQEVADGDQVLITYKVAAERAGKTENVFDYTMGKYDYQVLVDDVAKNHGDYLSDKGDSEYYYGASTYNLNFNAKISDWKKYHEGVEVTNDYIAAHIQEGVKLLLESKYTQKNSENQAVEGVVYNVRYSVYGNSSIPTQSAFKCTKAGENPEFELVEGIDAVETSEVTALYTYSEKYKNFTMVAANSAYVVSSDDFSEMGIKGDAFSSSTPAGNYLPQLLGLRYPFAQPNHTLLVVYRQDTGKKYAYYTDEYSFTDGAWVKYNPTLVKTDQFVFAKGAWMFDPSVRFTMTESDYGIMVDWVKENKPAYLDSYGTGEFWFGASTYNKNFDLRISRKTKDPEGLFKDKSDEEVKVILEEQIKKGLLLVLETKFPDAVPQKDGVDVYYKVTYQVYDGNKLNYVMTFKCIENGKFEYSEGPEKP